MSDIEKYEARLADVSNALRLKENENIVNDELIRLKENENIVNDVLDLADALVAAWS